ncbi:acyltransferase family protein [Weissella confusa]|uniref:Acyltransferase family protein n=1 Tax=Weissella confusa TaxID=1583 RepID=A0AAJ2YYA3_WEICO|nr:acyltransferase family protein [Weissella confusa]NBA11168.1 acyltransferase family protein [Weissella confusa]
MGGYESISAVLIGLSSLFIMPVFFALSGFFYRQVSNLKMFATNIYKKLISFGIPYLFFSVVYAVLQQFFGNVEQGFQALPRIFWMPIGYLWFLLVLFWIYVLVGIVDLLRVDYRLSLGCSYARFTDRFFSAL